MPAHRFITRWETTNEETSGGVLGFTRSPSLSPAGERARERVQRGRMVTAAPARLSCTPLQLPTISQVPKSILKLSYTVTTTTVGYFREARAALCLNTERKYFLMFPQVLFFIHIRCTAGRPPGPRAKPRRHGRDGRRKFSTGKKEAEQRVSVDVFCAPHSCIWFSVNQTFVSDVPVVLVLTKQT